MPLFEQTALDLDPTLKGKAAVEAAKKVILSRGKLKDQISLICNEIGIETNWPIGSPNVRGKTCNADAQL
eukprot:SAG31_NODE_14882_length_782_cov_1.114202_1_plen_70_part_00